MPELELKTPQVDGRTAGSELLQVANAESLTYIEWCKEKIAEGRYMVQLPPKPWAARDEVIKSCCKHFKNPDTALVGHCVDLAVMELWEQTKEDPANFQKQTMILRLKSITQLVLTAINSGRRETFVKYVWPDDLPKDQRDHVRANNKDPMAMVEVKVKQKIYTGIDMGCIHMLVSIERLIADLEGLYGNASKNANVMMQAFFDGLDKRAAQGERDADADTASMAARAKVRTLEGPASQLSLIATIAPGSESKEPIRAKVVRRVRGRRVDRAPMKTESTGDDEGDHEED